MAGPLAVLLWVASIVTVHAGSVSLHRAAAGTDGKMSVYVWNSRRILYQAKNDPLLWRTLTQYGINRLLLSLDRRQIDGLAQAGNKTDLQRFIARAGTRGIRVALLLGEPLWILPEYRPDLLGIISRLEDLPFSGLHLDLEPDQLDRKKVRRQDLVDNLVRTLQAVTAVSPWPVGVSLHPRYLDPGQSISLGNRLTDLGIAEVTLMIYVADPARVSRRALPILKQYPALPIAVAQSVEPVLPAGESYAGKGRHCFRRQMRQLRSTLALAANFTTLVIQSWQDFIELAP